MGMYTKIDFNGVVKPELRDQTNCFLKGEWSKSTDEKFREFGNTAGHADFIYASIGTGTGYYHENTGEWDFTSEFKNYDGTCEKFFELIPYFIIAIDTLDVSIETGVGILNIEYKFEDGEIKEVKRYYE